MVMMMMMVVLVMATMMMMMSSEGNPEFDGEMGAVHVRSSKLWLMDTSGTSTSLRGDRQFPMVRTIVKLLA
eukprot:9017768-Karenia_brevis.AAC.1